MYRAREETTRSKVLWVHSSDNRNIHNNWKKKKTKIKILQQGKEEMGKEQKRQTKVLVAPVCLAKKRLISRGGRISGLM